MGKTLFSWIGHADLQGMARAAHAPVLSAAVQKIAPTKKPVTEPGPVKTTIDSQLFDTIVLLWSYSDHTLLKAYQQYVGNTASILPVSLKDPTDYGEIYQFVEPVLSVRQKPGSDFYFLLSPGTPAMAAIWVLLGKTQYPGHFLQAYQGKVRESQIPFDLTLEVIPGLLRKTERVIQSLQFTAGTVPPGFEDIVGQSAVMRETIARADKAARYDVPVLLTGESGTGKEMFANAIWKASRRADKSFEAINCAALPANLLEAELFGYRKGAFTGADRNNDGAFKRLNGGTLFLDEVGECTPELQAKLLRVLQPPSGKPMTCREFFPIGADKPEQSDVRIIAATNRDLKKMIGREAFRSDLYFRLAAIAIQLPPLRERTEDILPIAEALLKRANRDLKAANSIHKDKKFCDNTKIFMKRQSWPGNVRQLFNAILQGIVMSDGEKINIADLGYAEDREPPSTDLSKSLDDAVKDVVIQYVTSAMKRTSGNKTKAARLLGMKNYQRLDAMLKKLNLDKKSW